MTDEQKKMKRYTNAVERRLNLPPNVRHRVMSDFISSIAARREAGQTDDEIYRELGSAKKAAADLNEQMREFAYHKSPWRFAFAALAAFSGVHLLGSLLSYLISWAFTLSLAPAKHGSIGIIGGADGPTAIFLTTSLDSGFWDIAALLLLLLGLWGYFRLRRCQTK